MYGKLIGMGNKINITIFVPAYNEEKYLANTIKRIQERFKIFNEYQIIIINDNSNDETPEIANRLAKKYNNIEVYHNKKNKGLGYNFKKGLKFAKYDYYMYIPGDDDTDINWINHDLIKKIGKTDIIIPYVSNQNQRPFIRRLISNSYVNLLNCFFNLSLKYYNGPVIHKTKILKNIEIKTNSFAYQTEILINEIKKGATFIQIPYKTIPGKTETKIFRIRNILGVVYSFISLFYKINIKTKLKF